MNKRMKVTAVLISLAMLFTALPGAAFAGETGAAASTSVSAITEEIMEAELNGRLGGNVPEEFYGRSVFSRRSSVIHAEKYQDYVIEQGIDVSIYNWNVDWEAVKSDGIDFAFVRAGGRGYGSSGVLYEDTYMEQNLSGASSAGIDTGVYFFSQAITVEEAVEEAELVIELLAGQELKLPVVFDYEYAGQSDNGRLYAAKTSGKLDNRSMTDICLAFCETIEAAGYDTAVYANASMLSNDLYASEIAEKHDIWLAHYTTQSDYEGDYSYWQYTEAGSVSGVEGNVDMNYRYIKPELQALYTGNESITLEWNEISSADGYNLYRKNEAGEYELLARLEGEENTTYVDASCTAGETYTYKVNYWQLSEDGTETETEEIFPEVSEIAEFAVKTVELSQTAYTYNGSVQKPEVSAVSTNGETLIEGTDYTLTWDNSESCDAGEYGVTVSFVGDYEGSQRLTYSINKASASGFTAKLSYTKATYSGSQKTPKVTVTDSDGRTVDSSQYTVQYEKSTRKAVGRYKVTVNFKNYTQAETLYFTIVPKAPASASARLCTGDSGYDDVYFSWSKAEGASGYYVYYKKSTSSTWNYWGKTTKTYVKKTNLTDGVKYNFKVVPYYYCSANDTRYKSLQSKTASVTTLKKVTVTSVAKSGTKVKVKWSDISGETGYQISRSSKKNGTYRVKTATTGSYSGNSVKSCNISATKGKTYWYKVRAYKKITVNGKSMTVYGPWSTAKKYARK